MRAVSRWTIRPSSNFFITSITFFNSRLCISPITRSVIATNATPTMAYAINPLVTLMAALTATETVNMDSFPQRIYSALCKELYSSSLRTQSGFVSLTTTLNRPQNIFQELLKSMKLRRNLT
ncbi:unnamed protein product [Rhizophagus irregularis]|nr:unnamed protein product [Rhizophagus irregularis]CAB5353965.1 unnamed protein product [Rhizophagus irregularis]